jgi:hypothetical protein
MFHWSPVVSPVLTRNLPMGVPCVHEVDLEVAKERVPRPDGGVLHDIESLPVKVTASRLLRFVVRYQYSVLASKPRLEFSVAVTRICPS